MISEWWIRPGASRTPGVREIMVVDPDEGLCARLARELKPYQIRLVSFPAVPQALTRLEQSRPDLLIADVSVGPGDGLVFVQQVRRLDGFADLPILLTSEVVFRLEVLRAAKEEYGFNEFLAKPYTAQSLLSKLRSLVGPGSAAGSPFPSPATMPGPPRTEPYLVFLDQLGRVILDMRTGSLRCEKDGSQPVLLYFRNGKMVSVSRGPISPAELAQALVRRKLVHQSQIDLLLEELRGSSGDPQHRFSMLLIEQGWLRPEQLAEVLAELSSLTFKQLFGWRTGTFQFQEGQSPQPNDLRFNFNLAALIFDALCTHGNLAQLQAMIERYPGTVRVAPEATDALSGVVLSAAERRLLRKLSKKTIYRALSEAGDDVERGPAVVLLLLVMGLLEADNARGNELRARIFGLVPDAKGAAVGGAPSEEDENAFNRLYGRAFRHMNMGSMAHAEEDFARALQLKPNDARTLAYLSWCRFHIHRSEDGFQKALDLNRQAAGADPGLVTPHLLRCQMLLQRGRRSEALASVLKALELEPGNPEAKETLQVLFRQAPEAGGAAAPPTQVMASSSAAATVVGPAPPTSTQPGQVLPVASSPLPAAAAAAAPSPPAGVLAPPSPPPYSPAAPAVPVQGPGAPTALAPPGHQQYAAPSVPVTTTQPQFTTVAPLVPPPTQPAPSPPPGPAPAAAPTAVGGTAAWQPAQGPPATLSPAPTMLGNWRGSAMPPAGQQRMRTEPPAAAVVSAPTQPPLPTPSALVSAPTQPPLPTSSRAAEAVQQQPAPPSNFSLLVLSLEESHPDPENQLPNITRVHSNIKVEIIRLLLDAGGSMEEYRRERMVCLFGYPLDEGHHQRRAMRAGLQIREKINSYLLGATIRQETILLRAAVVSGFRPPSGSGPVGEPPLQEPLRIAAGLLGRVQPWGILVTQHTARGLEGEFTLTPFDDGQEPPVFLLQEEKPAAATPSSPRPEPARGEPQRTEPPRGEPPRRSDSQRPPLTVSKSPSEQPGRVSIGAPPGEPQYGAGTVQSILERFVGQSTLDQVKAWARAPTSSGQGLPDASDPRDVPPAQASLPYASERKETSPPQSNPTRPPEEGDNAAYLPGTELGGNFILSRRLGYGSMGQVYEALDRELSRTVAIKIMSKRVLASSGAKERFRQEARALARVNCPQIIQIYSLDLEHDPPFLVLEFVNGASLKELLRERHRLPARQALEIILEVARGLRVAYDKGVIHRDINPRNIMLSVDGDVKLGDFGLAKSMVRDHSLTSDGVILGTPLYMSPEQWKGEQVDFRSDIYSLGITLFHLIVGSPPFDAESVATVMLKHISSPLPESIREQPGVTVELMKLLRKMTAKDPAHRQSSYPELMQEMQAILAS